MGGRVPSPLGGSVSANRGRTIAPESKIDESVRNAEVGNTGELGTGNIGDGLWMLKVDAKKRNKSIILRWEKEPQRRSDSGMAISLVQSLLLDAISGLLGNNPRHSVGNQTNAIEPLNDD